MSIEKPKILILRLFCSVFAFAKLKLSSSWPVQMFGFLEQYGYYDCNIAIVYDTLCHMCVSVCLSLHPLGWTHSLWRFPGPHMS